MLTPKDITASTIPIGTYYNIGSSFKDFQKYYLRCCIQLFKFKCTSMCFLGYCNSTAYKPDTHKDKVIFTTN